MKKIIILTPKQVKMLLSSLRSTSGLRSKEIERAYFRKMIAEIKQQTGEKRR